MNRSINKDKQEFIEGFNGILESERERKKMTPAQLAIRLSKCEKDSPAYVLLSHELNLRIAKVQSTAIYVGAFAGIFGTIIGIVIGVLLTAWIQTK